MRIIRAELSPEQLLGILNEARSRGEKPKIRVRSSNQGTLGLWGDDMVTEEILEQNKNYKRKLDVKIIHGPRNGHW